MTRYNLETTEAAYYSSSYAGYYQFVTLEEVVANFMIAYVGEDKIISKVSKIDVDFHAKRALQELSFDTFKSINSLEITVPSTLKDVLPQDYVHYTKVAWVDDSGIEHPIYPTSKTSNPQYQGNLIGSHDKAHLNIDPTDWTLGEDAGGDAFTWSDGVPYYGGAIIGGTVNAAGSIMSDVGLGTQIKIPLSDIKYGNKYNIRWSTNKLQHNTTPSGKFKVMMFMDKGDKWTQGYDHGAGINYTAHSVGAGDSNIEIRLARQSKDFTKITSSHADYVHENCLIIEVVDEAWVGALDKIVVIERTDGRTYPTEQEYLGPGGSKNSKTWDNYKGTTPSENNNDDYEDNTYWPHDGQRYGLDPQHAQANGSYYIDPFTHFIHFSSNLSGKTVVLKYLSDSMATATKMIAHKFAEEAMYKWIMYAILSTRANAPARQLMMLKKEKRAAIRQAKLRLSNIKLEELTQVLRGKSKQIKH